MREWPPAGAVEQDVEEVYERLAEIGLVYGEAFRGLRAAYTVGAEVYAEVELPEGVSGEASGYGIHPALLDAALHA